MSPPSFQCQDQLCRHYKVQRWLAGEADLDCIREHCEGIRMLRGQRRAAEPKFWQQQSFLARLALLFAVAFISYAFLRPGAPPPEPVPVPPIPMQVPMPPNPVPVPSPVPVPVRGIWPTPVPMPAPVAVLSDGRFEVDSLITCLERIQRQCLLLEIAKNAAEPKVFNRPTNIGRTEAERADQLQSNLDSYHMFQVRVAEIGTTISTELSTYLELLKRLHTLPAGTVEAAFELARQRYQNRPDSVMIAPKLARDHWQQDASLRSIRSDLGLPADYLPSRSP